MYSLLKNKLAIIGVIACAAATGLVYLTATGKLQPDANHIIVEAITLKNNDTLQVVHGEKPEKGLLIYIADKAIPNTEDYAKQFAGLSYYVVVVDNQALLSSTVNSETECLDLAKKLTAISTELQIQFKLNAEEPPILVGTEAGAASVYATLAQAGKHKFHAAVSINFSPQLKLHTPLCAQQNFIAVAENDLAQLTRVDRLPTSFYIFQDKSASPNLAGATFTDKISNAKLTLADGGKQTLAEAIQILQWLDPRLTDQISSDASDSDLPLIEVPVDTSLTNNNATHTMAILLTGDGGWAEIDKQLAKILAQHGIPTIALDSLSYFWKARTPESTSKDVEHIMSQYLTKWNKQQVMLIGYSFGADVLPFVANNLSADAQKKVSLIALLGIGKTAAFEFRLSSWMNADNNPERLPLLPEIEKMKWANSICIYGVADTAASCLPTAELGVKTISMSGDHHFDKKYDELVQHIIENERHN